jgi:hypothetical protein
MVASKSQNRGTLDRGAVIALLQAAAAKSVCPFQIYGIHFAERNALRPKK